MNQYKLNHYKALESIGAKDGNNAYQTLRRIQADAHYWDCVSCNGGFMETKKYWDGSRWRESEKIIPYELTEDEEDRIFDRLERRVKRVFGGVLPAGFFFNHDPRGYALKIKQEFNETGSNRTFTTDWGGYGLLAPDF